MVDIQPLVSQFTIVGKLEDYSISSKGRIKYLYLSNSEASYSIEVAKQKNTLDKYLKQGCDLRVSGMKKCKLHQQETIYKAYAIELISEPEIAVEQKIDAVEQTAKIFVCQGSSCRKQGANTLCHLLQQELRTQRPKVEIQITGCLKQCKQAPNLIMPGRNRYSRVQQNQIPGLVKQHLQSF